VAWSSQAAGPSFGCSDAQGRRHRRLQLACPQALMRHEGPCHFPRFSREGLRNVLGEGVSQLVLCDYCTAVSASSNTPDSNCAMPSPPPPAEPWRREVAALRDLAAPGAPEEVFARGLTAWIHSSGRYPPTWRGLLRWTGDRRGPRRAGGALRSGRRRDRSRAVGSTRRRPPPGVRHRRTTMARSTRPPLCLPRCL
jgi:hypothetical protein